MRFWSGDLEAGVASELFLLPCSGKGLLELSFSHEYFVIESGHASPVIPGARSVGGVR